MRIKASVISHPGSCREKNEDNFCFNGRILESNGMPRPIKMAGSTDCPILMGVFDGMGGIKAGEIASRIAAETASTALEETEGIADYDSFQINICKQANALACVQMLDVIKQRIGTTASMLLFAADQYHLCNIGDSPIFLFRDGKLLPIFCEHTEKENYIRLYGVQAVPPKKKFKLTQHIGIFSEEMEIEPYTVSGALHRKDRFLITSDGLTDMVDEEMIAEILGRRMSPAKTAQALLQQALDNGGKDNTTIICIDIK